MQRVIMHTSLPAKSGKITAVQLERNPAVDLGLRKTTSVDLAFLHPPTQWVICTAKYNSFPHNDLQPQKRPRFLTASRGRAHNSVSNREIGSQDCGRRAKACEGERNEQ